MIVEEYRATMDRYLADRALIPPGDLAELRLQDLAADPLGEIARVYGELGLAFSATFRQRLVEAPGRAASSASRLTTRRSRRNRRPAPRASILSARSSATTGRRIAQVMPSLMRRAVLGDAIGRRQLRRRSGRRSSRPHVFALTVAMTSWVAPGTEK